MYEDVSEDEPIIDPWEWWWQLTWEGAHVSEGWAFSERLDYSDFVLMIAIPLRCWARRAVNRVARDERMRRQRIREVLGRRF